jgi:hypothetical protein
MLVTLTEITLHTSTIHTICLHVSFESSTFLIASMDGNYILIRNKYVKFENPKIKIADDRKTNNFIKSQTHTFKSQIQNRLGFPNRNFKSQNSVSFQIAELCFLGFSNHSIKLSVLGFHLRITASNAFVFCVWMMISNSGN